MKRIVVGTGAGAVKQALPEIYDQLTIENFALGNVTAVPGRHGGNSGSVDGYYNIAGYDSASGTVSVSVRQGDPGNAEIFIRSFSTNVYCYYIDNE